MRIFFDKKQRELLATFFSSLAVAWFVAIFVVPRLTPEYDLLTVFRFLGNMMGSLILALYYAKEEL